MRKYILHAFPIRKLVIVALEFPKKMWFLKNCNYCSNNQLIKVCFLNWIFVYTIKCNVCNWCFFQIIFIIVQMYICTSIFYVEIKLTRKVALLVLICWHAIWYISLQLAIDNMNIVKGFQWKWLADWFNQSYFTYTVYWGGGGMERVRYRSFWLISIMLSRSNTLHLRPLMII